MDVQPTIIELVEICLEGHPDLGLQYGHLHQTYLLARNYLIYCEEVEIHKTGGNKTN